MVKINFNDDYESMVDKMLAGDKDDTPPPMPTGGVFGPTPIIGPASAALRWTLGTYDELESYKEMPEEYSVHTFNSGWKNFYFGSPEDAETARALTGNGYVNQVWRIEMDANQVLNASSDEFAAKWNGVVSGDVRVSSLAMFKNRYAYHQIALPSFVNAMAIAAGLLTDPIFHVNELLQAEYKFTQESQEAMIGKTVRGGDYDESLTWKRRTELWAALGEDNPEAYTVIGSNTDYDTESVKLNKLLGLIRVKPWAQPLWCMLYLCPDPRLDALSGSGSRLNVPIITEIYLSQEAAQAKADELKADREAGNTSTKTTPAGDTGLPVPEAWQKFPEQWDAEFQKCVEQEGPNKPPLPLLTALATDRLGVTVEELAAWWDSTTS